MSLFARVEYLDDVGLASRLAVLATVALLLALLGVSGAGKRGPDGPARAAASRATLVVRREPRRPVGGGSARAAQAGPRAGGPRVYRWRRAGRRPSWPGRHRARARATCAVARQRTTSTRPSRARAKRTTKSTEQIQWHRIILDESHNIKGETEAPRVPLFPRSAQVVCHGHARGTRASPVLAPARVLGASPPRPPSATPPQCGASRA